MQIIFLKKQDMEVIVSIYGYLPEPKSKKYSWVSKGLELSIENHRQGRFSPFSPSLSGYTPLSSFFPLYSLFSLFRPAVLASPRPRQEMATHPLHAVQAIPGE